MSERDELIEQCLIYLGEEENPFGERDYDLAWYWEMERIFVNSSGEFIDNRDYYEEIGGKEYENIPYALLLIMFTSWTEWVDDVETEIEQFYALVDNYLFHKDDDSVEISFE